jgi:CheY-like chemotaxis protein
MGGDTAGAHAGDAAVRRNPGRQSAQPARQQQPIPKPSGKVGAPRLQVQLLGIPSTELPELLQQIEELGHLPMLIDGHDDAIMQALRQPARIVIAEMAMPGLQPAALCRLLRQTPAGKETYLLLLASPQGDSHILEAIDAGADDVLVKPVTLQTLRVRLNTATRMLLLRDEIQRERRGIMRSTDQFAVAHKRLLREALTDTLTQLPTAATGSTSWLRNGLSRSPTRCRWPACYSISTTSSGSTTPSAIPPATPSCSNSPTCSNAPRAPRTSSFAMAAKSSLRFCPMPMRRPPCRSPNAFAALVQKYDFLWQRRSIPLTVSIGVAILSSTGKDSQALIEAADAALYQAKNGGRNRVTVAADN